MKRSFRPAEFDERLEETRVERKRVRTLVAHGRERDAEPDVTRSKAYTTRVVQKVKAPGPEAVQGNTNDLQGASFLPEGSQIRPAVGYVEVNDARESNVGSGFLISPKLFITNCHVMCDAQAAQSAQRTSDQKQRWCAATRLQVEQRFRRVRGCKHLPSLLQALTHKLTPTIPAAYAAIMRHSPEFQPNSGHTPRHHLADYAGTSS